MSSWFSCGLGAQENQNGGQRTIPTAIVNNLILPAVPSGGILSLPRSVAVPIAKDRGGGHLPIDIIATMTGPQAVSRMFPTA